MGGGDAGGDGVGDVADDGLAGWGIGVDAWPWRGEEGVGFDLEVDGALAFDVEALEKQGWSSPRMPMSFFAEADSGAAAGVEEAFEAMALCGAELEINA